MKQWNKQEKLLALYFKKRVQGAASQRKAKVYPLWNGIGLVSAACLVLLLLVRAYQPPECNSWCSMGSEIVHFVEETKSLRN